MRIGLIDMLVYRLFCWRWGRLLKQRPDLRELLIAWLKAYDVLDDGHPVRVTVSIEDAKKS